MGTPHVTPIATPNYSGRWAHLTDPTDITGERTFAATAAAVREVYAAADALGPAYDDMSEPHACDDCGTVYDEARGDGYCGQCPACADLAYEADNYCPLCGDPIDYCQGHGDRNLCGASCADDCGAHNH